MTHVSPHPSGSSSNVVSLASYSKKSAIPAEEPVLRVHVASNGNPEIDEELDITALQIDRIIRLSTKQALGTASSTELLEFDYQLQMMSKTEDGRQALQALYDALPSLSMTLSETLDSDA